MLFRSYPREFPARVTLTLEGGATLSASQRRPRPTDAQGFAAKLAQLWPSNRARAWPWQLPGKAPAFPG